MYLLNVFINNPISHSLLELPQQENRHVLQQSAKMEEKNPSEIKFTRLFSMIPQCFSASNRKVASCISSWVSDAKQNIKKIIKMKSEQ